mmetsp:Transcript_3132/g.12000  ORF Transcript_3132/g.12000 Transcript_3132/m.12000 type:complete len:476 (+) Transcript_3132:326-1753(+)
MNAESDNTHNKKADLLQQNAHVTNEGEKAPSTVLVGGAPVNVSQIIEAQNDPLSINPELSVVTPVPEPIQQQKNEEPQVSQTAETSPLNSPALTVPSPEEQKSPLQQKSTPPELEAHKSLQEDNSLLQPSSPSKHNTSEEILDALDSVIDDDSTNSDLLEQETPSPIVPPLLHPSPLTIKTSKKTQSSRDRQSTPTRSSPLARARSDSSTTPTKRKKSTQKKIDSPCYAEQSPRLSHDDMIRQELINQNTPQQRESLSSVPTASPTTKRTSPPARRTTVSSPRNIAVKTRRGSSAGTPNKNVTPASPGSGRQYNSKLSPDISHLQRFSPSSTYYELMHNAYNARHTPGSPLPHEMTVTTYSPSSPKPKQQKSGPGKKKRKKKTAGKKSKGSPPSKDDDIPHENLIYVSIRNKDYAYPLLCNMTVQKLTELIRKYHQKQVILWQIKDNVVSPGKVSLEYLHVRPGERLRVVQWIDV